MQQQLFALLFVCTILFIRMGAISFWRDTQFSRCLGYVNNATGPSMDEEALAWIDYSLKGQILQLLSKPTESIAESGVEMYEFYECFTASYNLTDLDHFRVLRWIDDGVCTITGEKVCNFVQLTVNTLISK